MRVVVANIFNFLLLLLKCFLHGLEIDTIFLCKHKKSAKQKGKNTTEKKNPKKTPKTKHKREEKEKRKRAGLKKPTREEAQGGVKVTERNHRRERMSRNVST